jgi:hypothetical protein
LNEMLLPEFDQEMATTRKFLERVPDDKFAGKLNEKSCLWDARLLIWLKFLAWQFQPSSSLKRPILVRHPMTTAFKVPARRATLRCHDSLLAR